MKRFLALALAFLMVFSCVSQLSTALAATLGEEAKDSMHFQVLHWHAVDPQTGKRIEDVTQRSNPFDVIEGYITPKDGGGYVIEMKYDGATDFREVTGSDAASLRYLSLIDTENGVLEFNTYPYADASTNRAMEVFAGFSISAGHTAANITGQNRDTLRIAYRDDVHLVKSHVFYTDNAEMKSGRGSVNVSGGPEQDTEMDEITGEKIYDTSKGLHTDKTASVNESDPLGRTFDIDLEAWYSLGESPLVAMILDASGSMAFTVGSPTPIWLDQDEIDALRATKLTANAQPAVSSTWNDIFLTDEQVDQILNKNKTDNSRLSSSNYTYYVYNGKPATLEYGPLGYWDGTLKGVEESSWAGHYTFTQGGRASNGQSDDGAAQQVDRVASNSTNFTFTGRTMVVSGSDDRLIQFTAKDGDPTYDLTKSTGGVLLDVAPSGEFTISFELTRLASDTKPTNDLDILYIGPLSAVNEQGEANNYIRLVRRGSTSTNRLAVYGYSASGRTTLSNLNDVFGPDYKETIRIVVKYENNTVTTYVTGVTPREDTNGVSFEFTEGEDIRIIFGGFKLDDNIGTVLIDNIKVFDEALEPEKVDAFVSPVDSTQEYAAINVDASGEDTVLGTVLGGYLTNTGKGRAGWYYINPVNAWSTNYDMEGIETAKTLNGTPSQRDTDHPNRGYTDTLQAPNDVHHSADTHFTYDPYIDRPVRFYIDSEGYLRCFFATAVNDEAVEYGCSYVYERDDNAYIKAEALQRALGAFVTQLTESSPSSEIAAVRFSSSSEPVANLPDDPEGIAARKKLVLRQWSNDTAGNIGALNLQYGDGGTRTGSDNGEYNYGLTGNTSTWTGLQAFLENMVPAKEKSTADKYLIIFTDGKDTDIGRDNDGLAQSIAATLRDRYNYKIFAVMLDGGPVIPGNDDYEAAKSFLGELTGDPNYVFVTTADDIDDNAKADDLVKKFNDEILYSIVHHLEHYTVQDYIDPRFDLVDASGTTWYLKPDNAVVDAKGNHPERSGVDENGNAVWTIQVSDATEIEVAARTAYLHYDAQNGMYFLRWEDQTIPNCTEDATRLNVWHGRITLRAKEDFIGGNAVLTNGHDELMNYVYDPADVANAKSDATSNTGAAETVDSPSKGFPRVVVNVPGPVNEASDAQLIYMGEGIDTEAIMTGIVKAAIENAEKENLWTKWYWEYLERYAEYKHLDPIAELIEKGTIRLPYYYLPDYDNGTLLNATGTTAHEDDKVGMLVYTLQKMVGDDPVPYTGEDEEATRSTETRRIRLSVAFEPDDIAAERIAANNELVSEKNDAGEPVYLWDRTYKEEQGKSGTYEAHYDAMTQIVSGEIAMQMLIPRSVIAYLQRLMPGQTITYQAALKRTYGSIKGELVGTFDLAFTVPVELPDDQVIVTVPREAITFTADYASYAATYGLPIGTYTLEMVPDGTTQSTLFNFGPITVVELNDDEYAALFARYPDQLGESIDGQLQPFTGFKALYGQDAPTAPQLGTGATDASYTNERYALLRVTLYAESGDLAVTKAVEGNGGDQEKSFTFTVTLSDTSVNGQVGDMKFEKGVATFTLKHGETKTAMGLPAGLTYTVTESDNAGYVVTSTGETGTIETDGTAVAAFTNTRNIGSLTVTKTVAGTAGETDRAFSFMVMLNDTTITGTYGDMTFSAGVATFTLKHGESKTATGLPVGVYYSVAELEADQDGYTTTVVGEKGNISEKEASKAIFVNTKDVIDVPQTGDNSHLGLWVTLLMASILGIGFVAVRGKGARIK